MKSHDIPSTMAHPEYYHNGRWTCNAPRPLNMESPTMVVRGQSCLGNDP